VLGTGLEEDGVTLTPVLGKSRVNVLHDMFLMGVSKTAGIASSFFWGFPSVLL